VLYEGDIRADTGPEIVLRNLISEWSKHHDVCLVDNIVSSLQNDRIKHRFVKASTHRDWLIRSYLERDEIEKSDVLFDTAYTITMLSYARIQKIPSFIQIHGNAYFESFLNSGPLVGRWRSRFTQQTSIYLSNYAITVSESAKNDLASYFGFERKIIAINNGVSLQRFYKYDVVKEKSILFVGNLDKDFVRKGIACLLKAFALLSKEVDDVHLVFVGRPSKKIDEFAEKNGLTSSIQSRGFIETSELVSEYNRAGVLVLPSFFDTYGLVVNESMACGTPVIVSEKVGASDMVRDANAGMIFPAGDYVALYNCLKILLNDHALETRLGLNAYNYARKNFGWDKIAERYIAVFRSALINSNEKYHAEAV
jgi:glycosyltransferase involved in cell wall biosynthesis